jgi:hypothetical protein
MPIAAPNAPRPIKTPPAKKIIACAISITSPLIMLIYM